VSLSGVRAASWRFAPYCSHGTRSLKLRRGVPQLQENSFAVARRDPLDFAGRGAVQ
jgi:hypothetical protein